MLKTKSAQIISCLLPGLCLLSLVSIYLIGQQFIQSEPTKRDPNAQPTPYQQPAVAETYHGVSISPRSFSAADYQDFYKRAASIGNSVTWAGNWQELSKKQPAAVGIIKTARQYNLEPIIIISPIHNQQKLLPSNPDEQAVLISLVADFAKQHKLLFLGFGLEVNLLQQKSPDSYQAFVQLFQMLSQEVKKQSPQTKVFTIFQYEHLLGMQGGLFGGQNNMEKLNQWQMLADFPSTDLIGITSYPFLVYQAPAEIPVNYYQQLQTKTTKPIAIIELGWSREGPEGWESSQIEQAEFISKYYILTKELKPQIEIWSFLFDPQTNQSLFNKTGLLAPTSNESTSYQLWRN